ncbi:SMI1/KNR4 family protein [Aneurinibacillus aneurinilyticus]|jgi:hypothetical protein|uniref:SMI1/KNR4 family protein n=1 Tax=Aneurinibacillus aneurinilyticus TaxID=1391 RepID=UPI0036710BC1
MEYKLEYLKKYTMRKDGYVRLIPDHEVQSIDSLPQSWYKIFTESEMNKKIKTLIEIWKQHVAIELRNTISYLENYLVEIELIEVNQRYSILYTINNRLGEVLYYEGRSPIADIADKHMNNKLYESWSKIPPEIRTFYENVHNGFHYYASGAMGLVALENVAFLGDDDFDWGILDDLEEPLQINLDTSFGFFSNGMGTYVAVDYNNCENDNATLWSAKDQPEYNLNFWDITDEWIVVGFES